MDEGDQEVGVGGIYEGWRTAAYAVATKKTATVERRFRRQMLGVGATAPLLNSRCGTAYTRR